MKLNKTYLIIALQLFVIEVWIALLLKDGFIRYTFGDYLVVIFLYCLLRALTNIKMIHAVILVGCFAFIVEFSQLFNLLEALGLSNNKLAVLLLGSTFHISDLIAYSVGLITVIIIENLKS
ncbi:MAG: DUF2809 domain-containing protein [Bacteroidota bacterium]